MTDIQAIRVSVVTASRAEYGLMRWIIHDLANDPAFQLNLIVTGTHLSRRHGHTVDEILADGHAVALRIPLALDRDDADTSAKASGDVISAMTSQLQRYPVDIVLVLGDRWELLPVAHACLLAHTPMGHVAGGEKTEGAWDDSVRHAVTKLSHLHFVANEDYAARVRQLGEEDWRICVSGGPGIDNFRRLRLLDRHALSERLGLNLEAPTAVVTFHPPTRSSVPLKTQLAALVGSLRTASDQFGLQYVVTGPNADPGADDIEAALREFVDAGPGRVYVISLGTQAYLSLLKHARLMIGNSSSAFHEGPVAGLKCVDIGDRQKGRISGGNVISVAPTQNDILSGIKRAMEGDGASQFDCPYGQGDASSRVLEFLKRQFAGKRRDEMLRKHFVDR